MNKYDGFSVDAVYVTGAFRVLEHAWVAVKRKLGGCKPHFSLPARNA